MKLSRSQRHWFTGATLCLLFALVAALLVDGLVAQWCPSLDLSGLRPGGQLSERSRATLTDTTGTLSITAIFPTEDPAALPTGRLLRVFAQTSRQLAGANLALTYVDPRLSPSQAEYLAAQGAEGSGLLFRQAGRHVFLPERALLTEAGIFAPEEAEEAIASAIARLSREDGITLGWLTGHGEPDFTQTDPTSGFSALRRALEREGYTLRAVSPETSTVPTDLGALLIVSPRYPITATERTLLADWLDRGGRLLCALPPGGDAGLTALFEQWGIRTGTTPRQSLRQAPDRAGFTDALSPEHPITRELAGRAHLILTAPRALYALPTRGLSLTPLVSIEAKPLPSSATNETVTVAMAAERVSTAVGADLALRPGRLLVLSEADFLRNARLMNHATANRDFALNAIHWLTGLSGSGAPSGASGMLRLGWDRHTRHRATRVLAIGLPLGLCLILWLLTRKRA